MPPPYLWILPLTTSVHFLLTEPLSEDLVVPTRQTSSSGKPKSPRIQVVLPENLCARLTAMAELESRTVSNMARVLIQQGVHCYEQELEASTPAPTREERLRSALESQQPRRLRGAPRRLRLHRPG